MRNDPDHGPTPEGAVITYARVPPRGTGRPDDRQEPYIDAREVPYRDDDLRAYDPDRGQDGGLDDVADALAERPRGRTRGRRRGARGAVLLGAVALAAGMVILAYAYGIATRVDGSPQTAGTAAPTPEGADTIRTTLPAEDAARSVPVTGAAPVIDTTASAPAAPAESTTAVAPPEPQPAAPTEPPTPQPAPAQAASTPAAPGSDGLPMDGDFALPGSGGAAQPALVAPVPVSTTPAAPQKAAPAPTQKSASAPAADTGKPADNGDDLMTNIEKLLSSDAAITSAQPAAGAPTPLAPQQQATGADALPPLPDPNALEGPLPPADVAPPFRNRLIPPADIPNAPPSGISGLR